MPATPREQASSAIYILHYYALNSLSVFWLAERVQWIFEISACDVITADYTIITSRTLKVTGNHVMYDRSVWLLRVIMSSSLALSCCRQLRRPFCFVQCIIKQLLDSVFVIFRIIKVSVRVISLNLRLRLITATSPLIILDITKTSSNKCSVFEILDINDYFPKILVFAHWIV